MEPSVRFSHLLGGGEPKTLNLGKSLVSTAPRKPSFYDLRLKCSFHDTVLACLGFPHYTVGVVTSTSQGN